MTHTSTEDNSTNSKFSFSFGVKLAIAIIVGVAIIVTLVFANNRKTEVVAEEKVASADMYVLRETQIVHVVDEKEAIVYENESLKDFILLPSKQLVISLTAGDIVVKDLTDGAEKTLDIKTDNNGLDPVINQLQPITATRFGFLFLQWDGTKSNQHLALIDTKDMAPQLIVDENNLLAEVESWVVSPKADIIAYKLGSDLSTYLVELADMKPYYVGDYENLGGFLTKDGEEFLWGDDTILDNAPQAYFVGTNTPDEVVQPQIVTGTVVSQILETPANSGNLTWKVTSISSEGQAKQYIVRETKNGTAKQLFQVDSDKGWSYNGNMATDSKGTLISIPLKSASGISTIIIDAVSGKTITELGGVTKTVFVDE